MKDEHVRIVGIVVAAVLIAFIVAVYVNQPQSFSGTLAGIGITQVDREAFESGRTLFHQSDYVAARLEFTRADRSQSDAKTQFYTAYSYYREGCEFFAQDDELLEQGLEAVERAIAEASDGDFPVDDPGLDLTTAVALKDEIEAGLHVSVLDIIPGGCK